MNKPTAKFQSFAQSSEPEKGPDRLKALRNELKKDGLAGFIIPRSDVFQGENVIARDERLSWLTGFTGSAGFCVALENAAGVFVDGRYTVQVKMQTRPPFTPVSWPTTTLSMWVKENLKNGKLGFDPWLHTMFEINELQKDFADTDIKLVTHDNLIDRIWENRPDAPNAPAYIYEDSFSGKPHKIKRHELAQSLKSAGQDAAIITQPDSIAWLLNIRGTDIAHLPITQCFSILYADGTLDLFGDIRKFRDVIDHLGTDVKLHSFDHFKNVLNSLSGKVHCDRISLPYAAYDILNQTNATICAFNHDIVALPRATKNTTEISHARNAHIRDATAMCRFLHWLDKQTPNHITEIDVAIALENFRSQSPEFIDLSFETISASGPNAALPHYRVSYETNRTLNSGEVMLVDSGAQYKDGTTDITRTIAIGPQSDEVKRANTLVLKGMISVSRLRFPKNIAGCDIDALARAPLWSHGMDFDHGTGHGIGQFLSVHEGPVGLSRKAKVPFDVGMIISNEPGFYKEGHFGIRIENLLVVRQAKTEQNSTISDLLCFETLNFVPIDTRLIDVDMLNPEELHWLNDYHQKCLDKIGPHLSNDDLEWLKRATTPI